MRSNFKRLSNYQKLCKIRRIKVEKGRKLYSARLLAIALI